MPTHVIELPTAATLNKKAQAAGHSALPQMPGKWLINKQLLAANNKQATEEKADQKTIRTSARTDRNAAVVYTVTNL